MHLLLLVRCDCVQSDPPGALKEAEGGEVVGRFEEVAFGRSFIKDAEAVELHAAAGSALLSQSQHTQTTSVI